MIRGAEQFFERPRGYALEIEWPGRPPHAGHRHVEAERAPRDLPADLAEPDDAQALSGEVGQPMIVPAAPVPGPDPRNILGKVSMAASTYSLIGTA